MKQNNPNTVREMIAQLKSSGCDRFAINLTDRNLDSSGHFFIWDDANELLHAIYANPDVETQVQTPFCMASIPYTRIEFTNLLFTS